MRGYRYASCIDVTLCSNDLVTDTGWTTDAETRGSDHFPILISHPRLKSTAKRRYVDITNWQLFRQHLSSRVDRETDVETLTSVIQETMKLCTKQVPIPDEYTSVDGEYEHLRAIRRRAERAYRRSGNIEAYRNSQQVHSVMRIRLQKIGEKRWREYCNTLSPLTPVPRIWMTIRALSGPVVQTQPFRALSIAKDTSELEIAEEFCKIITRTSVSITCPEFQYSVKMAKQKNSACF